MVVTDPLSVNVALFVGDLGGAGSGPVDFTDGAGAASSGLTYTFISLASGADDVDFSSDGVSYSYTPVPDVDGFDSAVRPIRINPKGIFLGGSPSTPTTFDLRIRIRVE